MTYKELADKISKLSPEQQEKPVELRDYANAETYLALDFFPMNLIGVSHAQFQIGFNEPEE